MRSRRGTKLGVVSSMLEAKRVFTKAVFLELRWRGE